MPAQCAVGVAYFRMASMNLSRGRDKRKGSIKVCLNRIWTARYIGWPALEESWQRTLKEHENDNESRPDETSVERLDDPG